MISPGQHVVDYVDDFLHGSLDAAAADYVEFHCAECKICRVAMDEAERDLRLRQMKPTAATPQHLLHGATEIDIDDIKTRFRQFQRTC